MAKLGHVITPWPNGLGSNFGWFSETSKHALSRWRHSFLPYFIPSWCNWGSKKWRFCKKRIFYSASVSSASNRFRILNFLTYPRPQCKSWASKRAIGLSPISFTFLNLSVAKLVNYHMGGSRYYDEKYRPVQGVKYVLFPEFEKYVPVQRTFTDFFSQKFINIWRAGNQVITHYKL